MRTVLCLSVLLFFYIPDSFAQTNCNLVITKITKTDPTSCADNGTITITKTGGVSPFQYILTKNDGSTVTQPSNIFAGLTGGNYSIRVADSKGCVKDSSGITLVKPDSFKITDINVLNPVCGDDSSGAISIDKSGGVSSYKYTLTLPNGSTVLQPIGNFRRLVPGVYKVLISDAKGCTTDSSGIIVEPGPCPRISIFNSSPISNSVNPSGVANLSVTLNDSSNNDNLRIRFYGRKRNTSTRKFTLIYLPDTQFYTGNANGGSNEMFKSQTNWIVSNRTTRNIVYVGQLGDLVNNGDDKEVQWQRADTSMKTIEDNGLTGLPEGIPYGICVGNHDMSPQADAAHGTTTFYNKYFGISRFSGRSYYGGSYGNNNNNHYELFTAGGIDFLVISLQWGASTAALDWAENLIKNNANRKVIVETHFVLNMRKEFSNLGQIIYDRFKIYPNFILLIGAHIGAGDGEQRRSDTLNGNVVHSILQDYQSRLNGGNGLLRIYEFDPDNNNVSVHTYSPYANIWETDYNSDFRLNVNLDATCNPFELIGEKSDVSFPDYNNADVNWPSLQKNSEYEWYVEVFDGLNTFISPTWSFKTDTTTNPPVISASGPSTFCEGGSDTLISNSSSGNQWLKDGELIEGATDQTFIAKTSGSYSVKVIFKNGLSSVSDTVNVSVKTKPASPTILIEDDCGKSVLTANNNEGSLLWSTNETTTSITVNNGGQYTVIQTVDGCSSDASSAKASPKTAPSTPSVTVSDNCNGSSTLSTDATGDLLWSTAQTTRSITVNTAGQYTVTQTINGCTSDAGSATASPKTAPATPTITVINNCNGSSTLSTNATGNLLWSTNETTSSITVNTSGKYTVTQMINGCTSAAGSATASPKTAPAIPSGTDGSRCGAGTMTLFATLGSGETIDWYATTTEGIALKKRSTTYTTPRITATTMYYAEARNTKTGCLSTSRAAITAVVNPKPLAPKGMAGAVCGSGTVIISALPGENETIDWYATSSGGDPLATGATSFATPVLTTTTTYYAAARNLTTGCVSGYRTAVKAKVNTLPNTPAAVDGSRCGTGTVTISAVPATSETIDWYDASSAGTLLKKSSKNYITPKLTATKTYYAEARNTTTHCLSATRTAVSAVISACTASASTLAPFTKKVKSALQVKLWPNPAIKEFTLSISSSSNDNIQIQVSDIFGRTVFNTEGASNQEYYFGEKWAGGTYIIKVVQGREIKTVKAVKGE